MKYASRRINKGVWLLAVAIAVSGCGQKSPEVQMQAAKQAQQKGDHKTAIVELKTLLQQQPSNGEARLFLAQSLYSTGELAGAEKELKKASELGAPAEMLTPLYGKVLLALGENQRLINEIKPGPTLSPTSLAVVQINRFYAYQALQKPGEAMQALAEAEKNGPDQPEIFLAKARLAMRDGDNDKAMQWIEETLKRDPKLLDALYTQAELFGNAGKSDAAIKIYQQIVANDAKQIGAYLAMSSHQIEAKNLEAAEQNIQSAEKINANLPMVKYARGNLEMRRGKFDRASSAFQDVLRVAPDHLPTALAYATASYGLGNYNQSFKNAGKVLGAFPDNLVAARIFAGSQLKLGDVKGVLKTLQPLLVKFPNDARMLAIAGEAYLRDGDNNKAMSYLNKAASLAPENASIKTRQAAGRLVAGDRNQAMADLEEAASLNDKVGQADLVLVMLHLKAKEYDKALQAITNLEKKLPNNPVTHNLRASALIGKRDMAGARKSLEKALAIQPTFFPAVSSLAGLDIQEKKSDMARKRYEDLLAKDKTNLAAMMALAQMADAAKNDKEMVSWLERAAKANPGAAPPRLLLVRYHLANKEPKKALALANEMASANPDSLEALEMLGAAQLAAGDQANALATMVKATKMAPQSPDVFFRLGQVQLVAKRMDEARKSFEKALSFNTGHLQALDTLINMDLSDNKPNAAFNRVRQIQAKFPNSPVGYEREGALQMSQREYVQAAKAFEQAITRGSDSGSAIMLHRALVAAGDQQSAERKLTAWVKAHPEDVAVRAYAAEFRMLAGQNVAAIALYEELLRQAPQSPVILNNLAVLYQRENDKRALATAEQANKLAPESPITLDTLGWILVEQGQAGRGLELLRKAVEKAPKADSLRYHYAVALARTGKQPQAKQELDALIKSRRTFPELEEAKALMAKL